MILSRTPWHSVTGLWAVHSEVLLRMLFRDITKSFPVVFLIRGFDLALRHALRLFSWLCLSIQKQAPAPDVYEITIIFK